MNGTLAYIGYILLAITILMVMITIHEFGHYIAGKILKFKINEFSIGFGPKLFSKKKKNGEVFAVRAIPLGGFCAFEGEDEDDLAEPEGKQDNPKPVTVFEEDGSQNSQNTDTEVSKPVKKSGVVGLAGSITGTAGTGALTLNSDLKKFNDQKPWKRIVVLLSGGIFNLLSAVLFSFIFICAVGLPQPQIAMLSVDELGDAYVTSLKTGDIVTHVNGKSMDLDYLFSGTLADLSVQEITLMVIRAEGGTEQLTLKRQKVVRREDASAKNGGILRDANGKIKYEEILDGDGNVIGKTVKDKDGNTIYEVITDESGEIITQEILDMDGNKYYLVTDEYLTNDDGDLIYNFMIDGDGNLLSKLARDKDGKLIYDDLFGVSLGSYFSKGVGNAFKRCVPLTGKMSWMVLSTLGKLITGQMSCTAVSGPIGTISGIAEGAAMGGWQFILIMLPLIAANLGVFNLLPIPALDGSKIIFCIIEWIRKKPINRKVENMIHAIGLLVLFGLVILVDITGMFARCGL